MRFRMNSRRKLPLAALIVLAVVAAVPSRAGVLLFTEAAAAYGTFSGHSCSQQLNSFGPLVNVNCGPVVDSGPGPGGTYVTTLSSSAAAVSATGGSMGVQNIAVVTSNFSGTYEAVQSLALAEVFDNLHFFSPIVSVGGMMDVHFLFSVGGNFSPAIAGPVSTILNSDLFYQLNAHTLDVKNFVDKPGPVLKTIDFDAGHIPNGGTLGDFEMTMQTSVEFDPVFTLFPVNASMFIDFLETDKLTDITATFNGQPVTDLKVTGDSGATYPTFLPVPGAPEPGTLALSALALASLLACRKHGHDPE